MRRARSSTRFVAPAHQCLSHISQTMMAESAGAKSPRAVTACQLSLSLNTCTRVRSGMTSFAEEANAITPMLPAARRAAVRVLVARIIRFIHQIHADMQPVEHPGMTIPMIFSGDETLFLDRTPAILGSA